MRKRKTSKIALTVLIVIFIAAGLMAFLGGPKAVSVTSQLNDRQEQGSQASETAENNVGNIQDDEDSQQVPGATQQGQAERVAGSQETKQSDYRIDVDVSDQIVKIYYQDAEIKQFTASTGTNDSTPLGDFEIQNRGEWFFSDKYQQGAKYWVSFKDWGVYLFHSVPMDEQKNIIAEEAAKLGTQASHGCVRLEVENAKWLYDTIPQGTKVHIH